MGGKQELKLGEVHRTAEMHVAAVARFQAPRRLCTPESRRDLSISLEPLGNQVRDALYDLGLAERYSGEALTIWRELDVHCTSPTGAGNCG